jgi:hypothetical protein
VANVIAILHFETVAGLRLMGAPDGKSLFPFDQG